MALDLQLKSWEGQGMDWDNPNPLEAKYWEAIRTAIIERLHGPYFYGPHCSIGGVHPDLAKPFWDIDFANIGAREHVEELIENVFKNKLLKDYKYTNVENPMIGGVFVDKTKDLSVFNKADKNNFIVISNLSEKLGDENVIEINQGRLLEHCADYLKQKRDILNILLWYYTHAIDSHGIVNVDSPFEDEEGERYSKDWRAWGKIGDEEESGWSDWSWSGVISYLNSIKTSYPAWHNTPFEDHDVAGYFEGGDESRVFEGQTGEGWLQNDPYAIVQYRKYYQYQNPWIFDYGMDIYDRCEEGASGYAGEARAVHGDYDQVIRRQVQYSSVPATFSYIYPSADALTRASGLIEPEDTANKAYACWFNISVIKKFDKTGGFKFVA